MSVLTHTKANLKKKLKEQTTPQKEQNNVVGSNSITRPQFIIKAPLSNYRVSHPAIMRRIVTNEALLTTLAAIVCSYRPTSVFAGTLPFDTD